MPDVKALLQSAVAEVYIIVLAGMFVFAIKASIVRGFVADTFQR